MNEKSLLPPHLRRADPPLGLITQLREIDPAAELVNIRDNIWWLGVVEPNEDRRLRSAKALERMIGTPNAPPGRVLRAMLGEAGFAFIAEYDLSDGTGPRIVEDFRERDWNARHRLDEAVDERVNHHEAMDEKRKADRLEEIDAAGREALSFAHKEPRSIPMSKQIDPPAKTPTPPPTTE